MKIQSKMIMESEKEVTFEIAKLVERGKTSFMDSNAKSLDCEISVTV